MAKLLQPTWKINSIYDIKPQDLLDHNIEAAIIDLDNTLIAWNEWEHSQEMANWIEEMLQAEIKLFLLSNNNEHRVKKACAPIGVPYKSMALKPLPMAFRHALSHLETAKEKTVIIGDQIMTDIIGANTNKIRSILVKPVAPNDNIYTQLNRALEKIVFKSIGVDPTKDWGDTLE